MPDPLRRHLDPARCKLACNDLPARSSGKARENSANGLSHLQGLSARLSTALDSREAGALLAKHFPRAQRFRVRIEQRRPVHVALARRDTERHSTDAQRQHAALAHTPANEPTGHSRIGHTVAANNPRGVSRPACLLVFFGALNNSRKIVHGVPGLKRPPRLPARVRASKAAKQPWPWAHSRRTLPIG